LKLLAVAAMFIVPCYVFFARFATSTSKSQTDTTLASDKFNSQDDSLNFGFGEEMIDYNALSGTLRAGSEMGEQDSTESDKHSRLVTESAILDFSTPSVLFSAEEMTTDYHGRAETKGVEEVKE
jgi:hypothetical protein